MRKSEYLFGRRPIRDRLRDHGEVTVSAVNCQSARGPWIMYVETSATGKASKAVRYRIRVKLKERVSVSAI
jgi:hypothetical protein